MIFILRLFIFIIVSVSLFSALPLRPPTIHSEPFTYVTDDVFDVLFNAPYEQIATYESSTSTATPTSTPADPEITVRKGGVTRTQQERNIEVASSTPTVQIVAPRKTLSPLDPSLLQSIASARTANLLCDSGPDRILSATAVFIHAKGILLSNAHVAESISNQRCIVRMGSPAVPIGYADLKFVSTEHKKTENPVEKSKYDISIWKISAPYRNTPLPDFFAHFTLTPEDTIHSEDLFASFSYPTEQLEYETIMHNLRPVFMNSPLLHFDEYFIETKESLGSQLGSSGGALMDRRTGALRGLIFAVSGDKEISERSLYSLQLSHIINIIEKERGMPFKTYVGGL